MTDTVQQRCMRPWWKRLQVWILGIAAVLAAVFSLLGAAGWLPAIPYGVAIIFSKPMLLVFGGLVIAVLVRTMPIQGGQDAPAILTKGTIT